MGILKKLFSINDKETVSHFNFNNEETEINKEESESEMSQQRTINDVVVETINNKGSEKNVFINDNEDSEVKTINNEDSEKNDKHINNETINNKSSEKNVFINGNEESEVKTSNNEDSEKNDKHINNEDRVCG